MGDIMTEALMLMLRFWRLTHSHERPGRHRFGTSALRIRHQLSKNTTRPHWPWFAGMALRERRMEMEIETAIAFVERVRKSRWCRQTRR